MSATIDADKLLSDVADQIKKEAYAAGWRDAIAALNKAISGLGDTVVVPERIGAGSGTPPAKPSGKINGKMPKQGTTPHAILMEVVAQPGMTGGQIVEAVRASGHTAPIPSIQTNIQRLKTKKLIVLRHGKWYAE